MAVHKFFPLYIKFVDTVEHDMSVDVPAAVMPVHMGADKRWCPGK